MKRLLMLSVLSLFFSCNNAGNNNRGDDAGNSTGNVEEHSGENISPQLNTEGDRFNVDTVSDAHEIKQEKKENLH